MRQSDITALVLELRNAGRALLDSVNRTRRGTSAVEVLPGIELAIRYFEAAATLESNLTVFPP